MKHIIRENYLKKIRPFYDSNYIKVITGIRRCGKSILMSQIIDEIKKQGIDDEHIIVLGHWMGIFGCSTAEMKMSLNQTNTFPNTLHCEIVVSLILRNSVLNWNNFKKNQKNADKPIISWYISVARWFTCVKNYIQENCI